MYTKALLACFSLAISFVISWLFYAPTAPVINLAGGRTDFNNHCARCHAIDSKETKYGPSLYGVGDVAANRVSGQSRVEYLWRAVVYPGEFAAGDGNMPANLAPQLGVKRTRDILAFIMNANGYRNYSELIKVSESLAIPKPRYDDESRFSLADIEAGKQLFFGKLKCASCHTLNPAHREDYLAGPSLDGIGLNEEAYLVDSLRNPSQVITPGYKSGVVRQFDKVRTGRVMYDSNDKKTMLVGDEDVWRPIHVQVEVSDDEEETAFRLSKTSTMPVYDQPTLNDEELRLLLSFLKTLR